MNFNVKGKFLSQANSSPARAKTRHQSGIRNLGLNVRKTQDFNRIATAQSNLVSADLPKLDPRERMMEQRQKVNESFYNILQANTMNRTEYGKLITSLDAKRFGSTGFMPPGQAPALGIGFSGEIKTNTTSQTFANRIQQSKNLLYPANGPDGLRDIENLLQGPIEEGKPGTGPSLPSLSYSLHNYNLKYFLIRQLLEQKGFEEIASMRHKLQLQSIKSEHFVKSRSPKSALLRKDTTQ